jgi:RNA polymerase sigma-70 factor (ECF subfamily)
VKLVLLFAAVNFSGDLALFQSLCKGDRASLNILFARYYESLCQFAFQRLKNRMDAEEVVSDVFFQIWASRANLRVERSVRAYLFTATRNACLAHARKRANSLHVLGEESAASTPASHTPESILETIETQAHVQATINRLPERAREVFMLSRGEGLTYAEIAAVLEISEKTVESHISHALTFLRDQLLAQNGRPISTRNRAVTIT